MAALEVFAAYDHAPLAALPLLTQEEVQRALSRAHAIYSDRSRWLSPETRIFVLNRLAELVFERRHDLALVAAREGGKPLKDSLIEIDRAATGIIAAKEGISRLTGREIPMGLGPSSQGRWAVTYREPRGVVLAISAFNHPFNLLVHQAVTAFSAGCPVLIKPARATPLSAVSLVKLLHEAGAPEDYVGLLLIDSEQAEKLVSDSRVAFLNFIGSAKVGWKLRSKLADGATCVLEHGGVAPVIVDETADLDDAVPLLIKGGYYHAGQVCVSVQRIYAHESIVSDLASRMKTAASELIVGDPSLPETDVGPLIDESEVTRIGEWVKEATDGGATLVFGGQALGRTTYAPTLLLNPPESARVSTQEVFGPVVCLYSYTDLDDAIRRANLPDAYFQAAYFTSRLDRALSVGRRLHGTAVMINDHTAFRVDWMPFGGHRSSGAGMGGIENAMHDMTIERMLVFRTKEPIS